MCSLMEKDALIEKVAETMALISRNKEKVKTSIQDRFQMGKLASEIYDSEPEDLDFWTIVHQCDDVQKSYRRVV